MDIRRAYLRRSVKQARLQKRLALAAMAAAVGCAAWVLQADAPRPLGPMGAAGPGLSAAAAPAPLRVAAQPAPAPRRVYPYSIVPGGVTSRAELAHALMADKVVAAHYLGFTVEHAALRTVAKARAVYVSYRKGDQVYWTARRVTLREGETVLSDGVNDIRTRCGNRISDTPQLPVEAKGPAEQELDTPFEGFGKPEGGLINTNFVLEDLDAGGGNEGTAPRAQPQPQSYPDGAGLLLAARAQGNLAGFVSRSAGRDRVDAASQPAASYLQGGFAWLADPAPVPDKAATPGGTVESGGDGSVPAADAVGGGNAGGGGSPGSTGATPGDPGGTGTTGTTGGTGGKPETTGPGQPPPATLRPDGLPNDPVPAKPRDVPEPAGLWLSALAFAVLLLQRRLALRRSR